MVFINVPTRGNSTRSTITGNKPGAMTPGGYGVDVKHGSYARYLGKLKGRTMALAYHNGWKLQQYGSSQQVPPIVLIREFKICVSNYE